MPPVVRRYAPSGFSGYPQARREHHLDLADRFGCILDTYQWAAAQLNDGKPIFGTPDGFERALADGFFFVQKPVGFDLSAGDRFAANFYLDHSGGDDDEYRGFRAWNVTQLAEREGHYCRDADQVEQYFLEARFWDGVFPAALSRQAREMQGFAVAVVKAILERLDLPREILERVTGGFLSERGTYHLTFNHFRPHVRASGLNILDKILTDTYDRDTQELY